MDISSLVNTDTVKSSLTDEGDSLLFQVEYVGVPETRFQARCLKSNEAQAQDYLDQAIGVGTSLINFDPSTLRYRGK